MTMWNRTLHTVTGYDVSIIHCIFHQQLSLLFVLCITNNSFQLVSVVARSKACTVFDHSNSGLMGLNPAPGMNVCLHFSVLCCPV
jgi:hypothetical protein